MAQRTLYAHVDGDDLDAVAADIEKRLDAFVAAHKWAGAIPAVINHRDAPAPGNPGALAEWHLGLDLALPDPGHETPGWFADVEAIAVFCGQLNAATRRDFVIGVHDAQTRWAEDLFTVDSPDPDVARLKASLGVGAAV